VAEVNRTWGGEFEVVVGRAAKKVIAEAKEEGRKVVHLTMYGLPLQDRIDELRGAEKILVVVGGPKVPGYVYHSADLNVAVTSQPHSEIAALAILLHEVQSGEELKRSFGKSKLRIIPSARGKRVVES
jgi:tRNA (cytidine56-2'-O)-methyltransferase